MVVCQLVSVLDNDTTNNRETNLLLKLLAGENNSSIIIWTEAFIEEDSS